jgi:hypothetical protein
MAKAHRPQGRGLTASSASSGRPGTSIVVAPAAAGPAVPAGAPEPTHRLWRVAGHVARCGVVVLAGVLVVGDLGMSGAHLAGPSVSAARMSGVSIRQVEAAREATASRAESLALANAALEAAAAADALSRTGPAPDPSLPDGAEGGAVTVAAGATATDAVLTPEQASTLQALESVGTVPALPAPLEPVSASDPDDLADDAATDDDTWADDASTDDALDEALDEALDDALDGASVEDGALDADPEGDALDDAATLGGSTDGNQPSAATADESRELAEAAARLTALVAAAGGRPLGPVDVLPVDPGVVRVPPSAPELTFAAPADASSGTSLDTTVGTALTEAVRAAAGEVFALSLRVEAATEATSRDEVIPTETALADLAATTASALQAADALVALQPLSEAEQSTRRPVVRTPSRPLTGRSPAVAQLAARWSNGQIPVEAMCAVPFDRRHVLQCDAAEALGRLNEAYRAAFGSDIRLTDSYRSLAGQIAVKKAKGFLAATPGTSNHGWGLAVDIAGMGGVGQFGSPGYLWLKDHAEDFGWSHPRWAEPGGSGPQEPWHWEFGTD